METGNRMLELVLDAEWCSTLILPKALLRYSRMHMNNNSIEAQIVLSLPVMHSVQTGPTSDGPMTAHRIALGPTIMGL